MKQLASNNYYAYALDVYECDCGFHIGLDATYLDQVKDIDIPCPNCGLIISTEYIGADDEVVYQEH